MKHKIEDFEKGRILVFKDKNNPYGMITDDDFRTKHKLVCVYSDCSWDELDDILNEDFDLYESDTPLYAFMLLIHYKDIKYCLKHSSLNKIQDGINLKIYPEYFQDILEGKKTFEIRKNDRNYQVGDILNLKEYYNEAYTSEPYYSGRELKVKVTYILDNESYLQPDYICMGFEKLQDIKQNNNLLNVEFENIESHDRFIKKFKNWDECHEWHRIHWNDLVLHGEVKE